MRRAEFRSVPGVYEYVDISGNPRVIDLAANSLAFSCSVSFVPSPIRCTVNLSAAPAQSVMA